MVIFSVSGGFGLSSWTFAGIFSIRLTSAWMVYGWFRVKHKGRAQGGTFGTAVRHPGGLDRAAAHLLSFPVDHLVCPGAATIDPAFSRLEEYGFEQTAPSLGSGHCVEGPTIAEDGPVGTCIRARKHGEIL